MTWPEPTREGSARSWPRRLPGALLVALGVAAGLEATTFDVAFLTDPVGPKALPLVVAVALVLTGIHEIARPDPPPSWPGRHALARLGLACAAFLAYALVLPSLGFMVSTTFVVTALARLFGARLRHAAPAATGLALGLWLLFVWLLALPLPVGDLWMR